MAKKLSAKLTSGPVQDFSEFFGKNVIYYYNSPDRVQSELILIREYSKVIHNIDGDFKFGFILGNQKQRKIKIEILEGSDIGRKWKNIFKKCQMLNELDFFTMTMSEELSRTINNEIIKKLVSMGQKQPKRKKSK